MTVRVTLGSACSQYLAGTALQANTTLVNKIHPKQCVPVVIDGLGIANEIRGPFIRRIRRLIGTRSAVRLLRRLPDSGEILGDLPEDGRQRLAEADGQRLRRAILQRHLLMIGTP